MATGTIDTGLKAHIISKTAASGTTIAAGDSLSFDFETPSYSTYIAHCGIYAGNPKCVITNIWAGSGTTKCTIFNPTSSSQTLQTTQAVRIVEFYL